MGAPGWLEVKEACQFGSSLTRMTQEQTIDIHTLLHARLAYLDDHLQVCDFSQYTL